MSRRFIRLLGAVATLSLFIAWMVLFRPQVLGGAAAFVNVDGVSMTPTMHNGDIAIVERKSSYHIGDIVAYRIPAKQEGAGHDIIHRIVGGSAAAGYVTKGDHNRLPDYYWHPRQADVIGRVWFHVPGAAVWMSKVRRPTTFAILIGLSVFLMAVWPSRRRLAGVGADSAGRSGSTPEPDQAPVATSST